ncbi:MAG: hypothetical protein L0G99_16055 [Propionibacteriales bacterium]|nr:hypothetical protein [Propionibacteriales bacterium]
MERRTMLKVAGIGALATATTLSGTSMASAADDPALDLTRLLEMPPSAWGSDPIDYLFDVDAAPGYVAGSWDEADTPVGGEGDGPYGDKMVVFPGDWLDTAEAGYYDPYCLSASGGSLRIRNYVEDNGTRHSAGMRVAHPSLGYDVYPGVGVETTMRVNGTSPFGHVQMFMPQDDQTGGDRWHFGEWNYPEGGHDDRPYGFVHRMVEGEAAANAFEWSNDQEPIVRWPEWHTYGLVWYTDRVEFWLDGARLASYAGDPDSGAINDNVPVGPSFLAIQSGTHYIGEPEKWPKPGDNDEIEIARIRWMNVT